jgi:aspartate aminotransferase-like enzyme
MEISNGYGDYKDKAFRIAHMGEVHDADLDRLFAAIEGFLEHSHDLHHRSAQRHRDQTHAGHAPRHVRRAGG